LSGGANGEQPQAALLRTGQGPPLLMLHGWGARAATFSPVLRLLTPTFEVVAPDFPGFGATPNPPAAWAVQDYAEWTLALLRRLELPAVDVIAHSFGGRVAVKIAAHHPETIRRLVLTGGAGIPSRTLRAQFGRWAGRTARAAGPAAQRILRPLTEGLASSDYRAATGTVRETFRRVVAEDLRPDMGKVASPTLLIWGDKDRETPVADGREIHDLIRGSRLEVLPGSHYVFVDQPAGFCRLVTEFFES
jgi:pimeloyl-ACP methyl ester carboxylesterase